MSTNETERLGILDWGIGGMSFFKHWRQRRPDVPVVYWSDTGVPPYGTLDEDRIQRRVAAVCRELGDRGASEVVVACNSASTAVKSISTAPPTRTIIEHAVDEACQAVDDVVAPKVTVLGGAQTISSGLYQRRLAARGVEVDGQVAQPLSGLVEDGLVSGPRVENALDEILDGVDAPDAVLLACTHYPAVRELIEEWVPDAVVVDPVDRLVDAAARRWPQKAKTPAPVEFVTTGDPDQMARSAAVAFDVTPEGIRTIDPELGKPHDSVCEE